MHYKIDEIIDLINRHGEIFFYGMIAGAAVTLAALLLSVQFVQAA